MKKAYLYPVSANMVHTVPDSYVDRFMNAFSPYIEFVNKENPSSKGILDIYKYLGEIDCVFLNWIEDLPDKRGGLIQSIYFIFITYLLRIKKIRIIWTLHNRTSHYKSNKVLKRFLLNFIVRKSDSIITLSREGLQCFKQFNIEDEKKIHYFPHPLNNKFIRFNNNPANDIVIWGSIIPYKGIDSFLDYLHKNGLQNKYKILIIGRVQPAEYEKTILKYCNNHIRLDNRYIPEEELIQILADSKVVLFTYSGGSVLSSGALMDSLSYGVDVFAPHVGAFKDAAEDKLIKSFENYQDLVNLLDQHLNAPLHEHTKAIERFIEENNWSRFALKIYRCLYENNNL